MTGPTDRLVRRASVALSAGFVVLLAVTLGYIVLPRVAAALGVKPPAPPPPYAAGDTVDVPAEWYNRADSTLIVFARASCGACEKGQPFLKALVTRMHGRGDALLAHPPGADADDRQFALGLGIADDRVEAVRTPLKVRATPTVLIVNRQGRILGAWEGVAKPDQQAAMNAAIDAIGR